MAGRWSFHGILCLLVLLFLVCAEPGFGCIERERQALLDFKHGVVDYYGVLSSWGEENLNKNCCSWRGILCSNQSGRVIMLRLPAPPNEEYNLIGGDYQSLRGEISSSLVELEHLTHLDLSHNDFEGKQIPAFLGSFTRMEYLNLSYTEFSGSIPAQLGNLSNLVYLDLRRNEGLDSGNLEWVSHLSSLRHLGMSSLDLTKAINWPQVINKLPSLIHLELDSCGLPPTNPSLFNGNSSIPPLEFLDLSGNYLITSSIYSWLFDFSATLFHLDLSYCRLNGFIPGAFGNMSSLEYLGLSDNQFDGEIPNALEHMESLAHLDLSSNQLRGSMPDTIGKMVLLSHLDLSHNQLQSSIPEAIGNMVSLLHLDLSYNQLQGSIPDAIGKMVLLSHLDLSINLLQGAIPDTIGDLVSLKELSLSYNHLQGEIPKSLTNLCNLQTLKLASNNLIGLLPHDFLSCTNGSLRALSLSENQFSGSVPHLIGFSSLTELRLDYNKFNGSLPERFGQNLQTLDISSNSFEGIISEAHLFNLSQLSYLDLSFNSLIFKMSLEWVPPFQLGSLLLASCKLGPRFPSWLRTQKQLAALDISHSEISDVLPDWFWNITSRIRTLSISNNRIKGKLPNLSSKFSPFPVIDMSSNGFEGSISQLPDRVQKLDLSNNKLSGSISLLCAAENPFLVLLDLSNNSLTGQLPSCLPQWESLVVLNLENNRFSEEIPNSFASLQSIQTLHLRNNNLSGDFPSSFKNCTSLRFIDLARNGLSGKIPEWIGGSLPNLIVLNLRSNKFNGGISPKICQLKNIQILELAGNNLSGVIPRCLGNFTAMTKKGSLNIAYNFAPGLPTMIYSGSGSILWNDSHVDSGMVKWKRSEFEFKNTLGLVKSIDLSSNELSGEIPDEVTDLLELVSLNLSGNSLSGLIPTRIGQLKSLDVLDLSRNRLFGEIPTSLIEISRISILDLSHNNFSGKIPQSTQLRSFKIDSYEGNPLLCGPPLPRKCPEDEITSDSPTHSIEDRIQQDGNDNIWFYLTIALGFIVGFVGACGTLLLKNSWRYAYFRFLNKIKDWFYVIIAVNIAKLRRILRS